MAEWRNGPYLRRGMRNDAFLDERNAVSDYPRGDGIWNSTTAKFGMKLYLPAEFGIQDHTQKQNEMIIRGGTRTLNR